MQNDRIAWAGPAAQLPTSLPGIIEDIVDVDHVENLGGALVTPGLIDAHTHPVYAGNRWAELSMRSGGSSKTEIISAGGGLTSTVTVTRGTDPWTLCNQVRGRMRDWLLSGTTTIEAKSGYHLTRDGELADVRLLRSLESESGMPRVHVTFFAAHSVPPEFFGRRSDYIDAVSSWCADAAAVGADWKASPGMYLILTDAPGKDAWPIAGATFILMHRTQDKPENAREVLKFFDWAYAKGDRLAQELDYVPMPDGVVRLIQSNWKSQLRDSTGKPVY